MFSRIKKSISKVQFIALGFLIIILIGTCILMLPISSKDGQATSFLDAMFTCVSATCVVGLSVADTFTKWSIIGQLTILVMIQIGGLGFISIGIILALLLRRKISLRDRGLMQECINTESIGGILKLTKKMLLGTLIFEGIGAVILSIRLSYDLPVGTAIYYGIFHSISSFCNAGFDLFGRYSQYNSLVGFEGDWVMNLTLSFLIIVGGLGFIVWDDISKNKFRVKKYSLHTKIVLSTSAFLLIIPTILFMIFEWNFTMSGMDGQTRFLASFFSAVTARTAGFNTVDTGALSPASKLLTIILMFIGGSPGSTAGGAKTTTLFVIVAYLISNLKGDHGINVFKRRLPNDCVNKATLVIGMNMSLFLIATIAIMGIQPELGFSDVLFETVSAIGTVGMTTGITRDLCMASRIIIMFLMFCGRIGSLSFALSFTSNKRKPMLEQPEEQINIG